MTHYLRTANGGRKKEFEHAIKRRFHSRSRLLKIAVVVVNNYNQFPCAPNLQSVVNAIFNWKSSRPQEFKNRCAKIWPIFHAEMVAEAQRYPDKFIECLDEIATPPTMTEALNWVNAVNVFAGLKDFSTYACLDATTFKQCIKGDQSPSGAVRTRERTWRNGGFHPYGSGSGAAITPNNRSWDERKLSFNYKMISGPGGRGAICQTFGLLAAHVLTRNGRDNGPRVELVTFPNGMGSHSYVLVGRQGGLTDDDKIPDDWDAVVVDAWAASLGHECVFTKNTFPYKKMMKGLNLVMQRPAS